MVAPWRGSLLRPTLSALFFGAARWRAGLSAVRRFRPQFHQRSVVIEWERGKENLGMSNCLPNESRNPQDGNDVKQFAHYSPSAVSTWQRAVMLSTQVSQQVYAWLKQ